MKKGILQNLPILVSFVNQVFKMEIQKLAEKLFKDLEELRAKHIEALKNAKKATKYVTDFPATFMESPNNISTPLKPTIDNMKNQARKELAEEYKAKKEMEQVLEEIKMKLEIITNQVKLLEYMPLDNKMANKEKK